MADIEFTILGDTISKANNRRLITVRGSPRFILSRRAVDYLKLFDQQCPVLDPLLTGDLQATLLIYYGTRRPDLDESLILDAMQGKIYENDRQIKIKYVHWGLDRGNPRAIIRIVPIPSVEESFGDGAKRPKLKKPKKTI